MRVGDCECLCVCVYVYVCLCVCAGVGAFACVRICARVFKCDTKEVQRGEFDGERE